MRKLLKLITLDEASRICMEGCPYATLLLISCVDEISHSELTRFLANYTIEKSDFDSQLMENIVNSLLRNGHIYEVRGGFYSALPPYAIQRKSGEWVILGDARVDYLLKEETADFKITSLIGMSEVMIERLLFATDIEAERIFNITGTRTFNLADLVGLIPDTESLVVPAIWPNYLPTPYPDWQRLNEYGQWESMEQSGERSQCLCRGLLTNIEGRITRMRYFFRHRDGWSPITYEEGSQWVFKLAASAGKPYSGRYLTGKQSLILPVGLPHTAYMVLRYLGNKCSVKGDKCIVEGIDYNVAQTVCQRLGIKLTKEVIP